MKVRNVLLVPVVVAIAISLHADTQGTSNVTGQCVDCHTKTTPKVVTDWKQSRHSQAGIGCDTCHGS